MQDVGSGMSVKNICNLVLKEIYDIFETKNPTKEQVNEYKMAKREIYKKFTNLSKKGLNIKTNKILTLNDVMTIKRCRGKKQEVQEQLMDLEKK